MKLWVISDYFSSKGSWKAGDVIDVDEDMVRWLKKDAPGCFSLFEPIKHGASSKAPSGPAADKMVKVPQRSKGWDDITVAELRKLLADRGLPTTGKKAELIERLAEHEDA